MIIGIGMDLVEIGRIGMLIERWESRAVQRLFTPREVSYCAGSRLPAESFAARFAAKEALFKALGTGWGAGVAWRDVEILRRDSGAPAVLLSGAVGEIARGRGVERIHVSLTHTSELAAAYIVLEGKSDSDA